MRHIEELSMNAWPSLQNLHYDGWVLRTADGYTKRANSVYPLYDSILDLDQKIKYCESFYREQGLPTVFKITAFSLPARLDIRLEELGYRLDSLTSVQTLPLKTKSYKPIRQIELTSRDSDEWHAAFARMNHVSPAQRSTHEKILRAIQPEKCCVSIREDDSILGCGLGVMQAGYLGIFDIVIDPDHRRYGFGVRLMKAVLGWGKKQGAHTAYLQVMCNNSPALNLYKKLGFQEQYQYWYRIQP